MKLDDGGVCFDRLRERRGKERNFSSGHLIWKGGGISILRGSMYLRGLHMCVRTCLKASAFEGEMILLVCYLFPSH